MVVVYKDINQFYDGKEEKDQFLYNVDDIFQSIQNIIETPKGTRAFLPEFGCDLEQYLFDPNTEETRFAILMEIYEAIKRWEPRVKMEINLSQIEVDPKRPHTFDASIVFRIVGLDERFFEFRTKLRPNKENYIIPD